MKGQRVGTFSKLDWTWGRGAGEEEEEEGGEAKGEEKMVHLF